MARSAPSHARPHPAAAAAKQARPRTAAARGPADSSNQQPASRQVAKPKKAKPASQKRSSSEKPGHARTPRSSGLLAWTAANPVRTTVAVAAVAAGAALVTVLVRRALSQAQPVAGDAQPAAAQ